MAYAFDDDKSKVEVCAKGDFLMLEKTFSSVATSSTTWGQISVDVDLSEYILIGVEQIYDDGGTDEGATATSTTLSIEYTFPKVEFNRTYGYVVIHAINCSKVTAKDITVRVVLMKIS